MASEIRAHPRFGEIYDANLVGGENIQSDIRPVVIAQNDTGNRYSPTVEVVPMSPLSR
ncbi:type II toxin-antitoxin system PemK/MazF family toxin [uncultured Dysosmobacter sp.]|uniref:type II toxin-antitoxin system PemK/MazF family toxin n=1 Tax=uncultured Dysosmobacter sp. TaxID=2591384 RepID=UPI00262B88E5|nr:type II toxin-antitoxin system PemK/MazF family toxin [uncultured Dysosmobacter sp.]